MSAERLDRTATDTPVDAARLEKLLRQLEGELGPGGLRLLDHAPLEETTCFPCYLVNFSTTEGRHLKLFLKDYSAWRLPKDGLAGRTTREVRVYRDLLSTADLGTAAFNRAGQRDREGYSWLLLEYVPGVALRACGFDAYVRTAGWLGKLHAHFGLNPGKLDGADFLVQQGKDFFRDRAQLALHALRDYGRGLADRFEAVLEGYDTIVERLAAQDATLVHGSFRPQNILLLEAENAWRVCPVDWELAALGSPFYDLAFLVDGFAPRELDLLLDHYCHELAMHGMPVPARDAMLEMIAYVRLHKMAKSLADSQPMAFPISTVAKILAMAEKVRGDIVL